MGKQDNLQFTNYTYIISSGTREAFCQAAATENWIENTYTRTTDS